MTSHGSADPDDLEFERSLREVEQSLLLLKARYAQVQSERSRQQELQQRQRELHGQLRGGGKLGPEQAKLKAELKAELKQVEQQLEALEVALESQLFSWSGLKEIFWQAVRFGGLGIILGWVLKSLAG